MIVSCSGVIIYHISFKFKWLSQKLRFFKLKFYNQIIGDFAFLRALDVEVFRTGNGNQVTNKGDKASQVFLLSY